MGFRKRIYIQTGRDIWKAAKEYKKAKKQGKQTEWLEAYGTTNQHKNKSDESEIDDREEEHKRTDLEEWAKTRDISTHSKNNDTEHKEPEDWNTVNQLFLKELTKLALTDSTNIYNNGILSLIDRI